MADTLEKRIREGRLSVSEKSAMAGRGLSRRSFNGLAARLFFGLGSFGGSVGGVFRGSDGLRYGAVGGAGAAVGGVACDGGGGVVSGPTNPSNPSKYSITGCVVEFFSNSPLVNLDVLIEGSNASYVAKTDANGNFVFELPVATVIGQARVLYGISKDQGGVYAISNPDVVPQVFENVAIGTGGAAFSRVGLASSLALFGGYEPYVINEIYRGRNFAVHGTNSHWSKSPDVWVIYDPGRQMEATSNPRESPAFLMIYKSWQLACRLTNGTVTMPSASSITLKIGELPPRGQPGEHLPDGVASFIITPPPSIETGEYQYSDPTKNYEIISSEAMSPVFDERTPQGEAMASFLGGGNESSFGFHSCFDGMFFESEFPDYHWRQGAYMHGIENGSRILPSGKTPSPFGFPVEYRRRSLVGVDSKMLMNTK